MISIGYRAAADYIGLNGAHHIVALGDNVVVPDDSPSFMLYVAGQEPRPLLHIDKDVGRQIKREARTIFLSPERMGLPDFVPNLHYMSDVFWDGVFADWNASARACMGEC